MPHYQHILAPVDFSPTCEKVVVQALELAKFYDAKMTLLHSVQDIPVGAEPFGEPAMLALSEELEQQWEENARNQMQALADKFELPLSVARQVVHGFANDTILQFAQEQGVDLIVIGHSGRKGFFGLLGSTANKVVKSAHCNVLVIHQTPTDNP